MSLPRFHCDSLAPGLIHLDESESRHALSSLRLRPGDEAVLFDGHGCWTIGKLQPATPTDKRNARRSATFIIQEIQHEPPLAPSLTLIVAACKGPRLSWMIEKLTELGTSRIVLAEFERSVVRASAGHAEKLRRTALEAAKQSQRAWLPEIVAGISLDDTIAVDPNSGWHGQAAAQKPDIVQSNASAACTCSSPASNPRLLIAHPDPHAASAADEIRACIADRIDLRIVIGPEGGLTDAELSRLTTAAGRPIRLAPHILRIETAALAVASLWAAQA